MKVALLGSKTLGLEALRCIRKYAEVSAVITAPDRDDGRSRLSDLVGEGARVAESRGDLDFLLSSLDAELVIVAGWYSLIPDEELRRRRFIGIHHSLLPRYRGGSPLVWALLEGEEVVGTSIFSLTREVDAGPIWAQASVPTGDGYIGDVLARCDETALALLPTVFDSNARPTAQDSTKAMWRPRRYPKDGLIDWSLRARDVVRWIRAQSRPYPGAFTFSDDQQVTIWRARLTDEAPSGSFGQIVDGLVTCGDHRAIAIEEASVTIADGARLSSGPPVDDGSSPVKPHEHPST